MAGISPPVPFLPTPGKSTLKFEQWFEFFTNYTLASGSDRWNAERRKALLLHCLGTEGQRIYSSLPEREIDPNDDVNSYDATVAKLRAHFNPRLNVVAERYKFRQRRQLQDETSDEYVRELRQLSISCNFGVIADEMIRDQLVEKTNSSRIRERLLLEPELTLNTAIEIARQCEHAAKECQIIGKAELSVPVEQIRKSNYKPKQQPAKYKSSEYCFCCGSKSHKANDVKCKAKKAKCNKCCKIGHFASVCRSVEIENIDETMSV
ncbi:uncharacterized protein [Antedon mediterranea]|uniref:uncharacterized protein n=1 Tax=Antedon mediterranea TaxID=105859 RepID=UPI003AF77FC9